MTKEKGLIKQKIYNILFSSEAVCKMLFDDIDTLSIKEKKAMFLKKVKSHLFIDDTSSEIGTYIFYDVTIPNIRPQLKECAIVMYLICSRDIIDDFEMDGYYGNRADILSQIVEETLLNGNNVKQFGIGDLQLISVDIYNSKNYYGVQMIFKADCFR